MKNPGHYFINDFKQGNKDAFTAVYNTYYAPLYYFTKRILDDRQQAEDIIAETFVKLWNLRANFETHQNIKAFLYITARNACLDYLRSMQRQTSNQQALQYVLLQDTDITFTQDEIKVEVLKQVHDEIENLPSKCRRIFKMAYLEGLPNAEIAEQLNINLQTVKNQKVRAIKILRIALVNIDLILLAIIFMNSIPCL